MVTTVKPRRSAKYAASMLIALALLGCSDSSDDEEISYISLSGTPVKGPLANATVSAYLIDTSADDFLGELVGSGVTDDSAQISELQIAETVTAPLIIKVTANDDTTDITTSDYPVITEMATLIAEPTAIDSFYPSPITTLALSLAMQNADSSDNGYAGDTNGDISEEELISAFDIAAEQVLATLGYGIDTSIDINTTSPILNDSTADNDSQTLALAYRTAIEAVSAIAVNIQSEAQSNDTESTLTTTEVLAGIALDLSDGEIDGTVSGESIAAFSEIDDVVADVTIDISELTIPGTTTAVTEIATVLVSETETTGQEVDTSAISSGEVSYTPDTSATTTVEAADSDSDGIPDSEDNCPASANSSQLDTDNDGKGNACDSDDDGDGVSDSQDEFPLDSSESADYDQDGIGNNEDADDDNDGTEDTNDAFPFDDSEQLDTDADEIGNNADDDDDGDGVSDSEDLFPLDATETADNDLDGIGNNRDTDDDNDGIADTDDNCPFIANAGQEDADGDGLGDVCVKATWDEFTWDGAVWQ